MRVAAECASGVIVLFEAVDQGNTEKQEQSSKTIVDLEHQADQLKKDLLAHLPRSLLLPVDRRDLVKILEIQDSIANTAQDITALIAMRPFEIHPNLHTDLFALIRRCIDASNYALNIIDTLDSLVETGFRGPQSDMVNAMADELNKIESDTDQIASDLKRKLFALEVEMSPVSIMLWYELINKIANIGDHSEMIGNRVRLLLAK